MYHPSQNNGCDRRLENLARTEGEALALKFWFVDLAIDSIALAQELESDWTVNDCAHELLLEFSKNRKSIYFEGPAADVEIVIKNAIAMALRISEGF